MQQPEAENREDANPSNASNALEVSASDDSTYSINYG